jgi:hypothetical protein
MEREIAKAVPPASTSEVAEWVRSLGKDFIEGRDKIIAAEEASWRRTSQPQFRRTPMPGALGRAPTVADTSNPRNPSHPAPASLVRRVQHINPRTTRLVITGLLVLVLLLGIGVIWSMKSGGDAAAKTPATAETRPPEPVPAAAPAPPIREVTVERPQAAKAAPPITAETPAPHAQAREAELPTPAATAPEAKPVAAPVRRTPPRPAPRIVAKKVDPPAPAPVPAAAAAPDPKADCNPPYYYEGSKKVFKPNCL